jgi:hypothetical protein
MAGRFRDAGIITKFSFRRKSPGPLQNGGIYSSFASFRVRREQGDHWLSSQDLDQCSLQRGMLATALKVGQSLTF